MIDGVDSVASSMLARVGAVSGNVISSTRTATVAVAFNARQLMLSTSCSGECSCEKSLFVVLRVIQINTSSSVTGWLAAWLGRLQQFGATGSLGWQDKAGS